MMSKAPSHALRLRETHRKIHVPGVSIGSVRTSPFFAWENIVTGWALMVMRAPFQIHRIEQLILHLAGRDGAGSMQHHLKASFSHGQYGDDAEISNVRCVHACVKRET